MKNKERGWVYVYDSKSLPCNKKLKDIAKDVLEKGVIEWDSSKGGNKPQITNLGGDKNEHIRDCEIIDIFKINSIETTIVYKEKIVWFLGDEKVGESHLPECTFGGERDWLAWREDVKSYNRVQFIGKDGIRYDSNNQTREDGENMGEHLGRRYQERIKSEYFA